MAVPEGTRVQLVNVRCPTCTHTLFKVGEGMIPTQILEIKCHRCGTLLTFHPNKPIVPARGQVLPKT